MLAFLLTALVPVIAYTVLVRLQTAAALTHAERTEASRALQSVNALLEHAGREDVALLRQHLPNRPLRSFPSPAEIEKLRESLLQAAERPDRSVVFMQMVTGGGLCLVRGSLLRTDVLTALGISPGDLLEQPTTGVVTVLNEPYLVSMATLRSRTRDRALATVVLARFIDDKTLAGLASLTGTRLAVFVDGVLVAASHRDGNDGLEEVLVRRRQDGEIDIDGEWTVGYVGLGKGEEVVLRVAVPRAPFAAASSSLSSASGWLIAIAVTIALLTALIMSRTLGKRLRALGAAARAITRQERPPHLDISSNDDIAAVARSFNDMSAAVQSRFDDLRMKLDGLTDCLADLNLVGETLSSSPDVHKELSRVAVMLRQMTSCDIAAFHLEFNGALLREVCAGDPGEFGEALDRMAQTTATSGSPVYSRDLVTDERFAIRAQVHSPTLSSARSLPLIHQRRVLGAVTVASREPRRLQGRSAALLATVASQTALALSQARTYQELERSYLETVSALLAALEAMDADTADHGASLINLAVTVGEQLGLDPGALRRVQFAAALHDIGKIGVPVTLLRKTGPLNREEWRIMEQHTIIGERIVARIHYLEPIARIVRSAHERWDGLGYPDGLRATEIPLEARIVFVCDAYHAMISDRPYQRARSPEEAMEELWRHAGAQFDPAVVQAFALAVQRVPVVDVQGPPAEGTDTRALEIAASEDG